MLSLRLVRTKIFRNSFNKKFCHHDTHTTSLSVRGPAPQFKGQAWWKGEFKPVSLEDFNIVRHMFY